MNDILIKADAQQSQNQSLKQEPELEEAEQYFDFNDQQSPNLDLNSNSKTNPLSLSASSSSSSVSNAEENDRFKDIEEEPEDEDEDEDDTTLKPEELPELDPIKDSCDHNPEFAVICSFITNFGKYLELELDIELLKACIENRTGVDDYFIDLHVKLLRKFIKYFIRDRWEKALIRFVTNYSFEDAYELRKFGYAKTRPSIKLELLRRLLDAQFEFDQDLKTAVNNIESDKLRISVLGRDYKGNNYWDFIDQKGNFRIYQEEPVDNTYQSVCTKPEELNYLIDELARVNVELKSEDDGDVEDDTCKRCDKSDNPEQILLCDMCDVGYHTTCCVPPLVEVPEDDWYCPRCEHRMLVPKLKKFLAKVIYRLQTKERERLKQEKQRQNFLKLEAAKLAYRKRKEEAAAERAKAEAAARAEYEAEVAAEEEAEFAETDLDTESEDEAASEFQSSKRKAKNSSDESFRASSESETELEEDEVDETATEFGSSDISYETSSSIDEIVASKNTSKSRTKSKSKKKTAKKASKKKRARKRDFYESDEEEEENDFDETDDEEEEEELELDDEEEIDEEVDYDDEDSPRSRSRAAARISYKESTDEEDNDGQVGMERNDKTSSASSSPYHPPFYNDNEDEMTMEAEKTEDHNGQEAVGNSSVVEVHGHKLDDCENIGKDNDGDVLVMSNNNVVDE